MSDELFHVPSRITTGLEGARQRFASAKEAFDKALAICNETGELMSLDIRDEYLDAERCLSFAESREIERRKHA